MTRYARRTDRTHVAIKRVFERVGTVRDCAKCGFGIPDLMVKVFGQFAFVEVKDGEKPPSARKLSAAEQEVKDFCDQDEPQVPYYVVASVEEAEALIESIRQALNEEDEEQTIEWMQ